MLHPEQKLGNFSDIVMKEAIRQHDTIIREVEEHKKEELEKRELESLETAYNYIQQELSNQRLQKNLAISKRKSELKKHLLSKRQAILNHVFDDVTKQIASFAKSDKYRDYMEKALNEALNVIGEGPLQCICRHADKAILNTLAPSDNVELVFTEDDIIGGFIMKNLKRRVLLDYTLKTKIESERDNFLGNSGLVI